VPFNVVDRRPGDTIAVWAATEYAESELGWKAKLGLKEMCRDQWAWAQKHPKVRCGWGWRGRGGASCRGLVRAWCHRCLMATPPCCSLPQTTGLRHLGIEWRWDWCEALWGRRRAM
jgi:hypothetical protein